MSFSRSKRLPLVASCVCILAGVAWADQIVLKNGDRVTGSIVKKDGKTLTIKTEHFGVVTTDWDQVASITADKPVNVVLKDGKTAQGTLATSNGQVQVAGPGTNFSVAPADITTIRDADEQEAYERRLKPTFGQLWAGTGSVGLAGAKGNAETLTFTTGIAAARTTNTDKTAVYFNVIKASALTNGVDTGTAKAVRGGISYDHNVAPRVFVNIFNDYAYDKFQALNLRVIFGGGAGFHAVKTKRSQLDLVAGADYNHASLSSPLTQSSAEFYCGDDYNMKLTGSTSLIQSFRLFDGGGAHRINFSVGASTKISKWLNWNLALSDWYVSDPAPGKKDNDFLYTTGVGVTFGK
jgi:putative salt-induced outer membrane protein YdiY